MNDAPETTEAIPAAEPPPRRTGTSLRLLLTFCLAAALLGGSAAAWLAMRQFNAAQQRSLAEFQGSMSRMEQRLTTIQYADRPKASAPLPPDQDAAGLLSAANLEARDGHWENAVRLYAASAEADSSAQFTDEARYQRALCLTRLNRAEEATEDYRVILMNHPGSGRYASAAVNMARLLIARGSFAPARRLLWQAIALRDRPGQEKSCTEDAWFELARCYEGESDATEKARQASLALGLQPGERGKQP